MAANKQNLEELAELRETGNGNIINGIGKVLGNTISAVAKGGSTIIRSLGRSIHDTLSGVGDLDEHLVGSIGNATSKLISSTTTGVAKVISSLGGVGNIILWALVILLYLFLFFKNSFNTSYIRYQFFSVNTSNSGN